MTDDADETTAERPAGAPPPSGPSASAPVAGPSIPDAPPAGRGRGVFRRPTHPWLVAVAIVLVVAVALEGYVRWVEPQFETLRAGDSAEMILKAERIEELGKENPKVDVVFFGNSMMDTAISPAWLIRNSKTIDSAYNAAVVGAPLQTRLRWSQEIVLDNLDPETIVLGVHPVDLLHTDFLKVNQDATQADVIFGKVLRETDQSFLGEIQRALDDNIAVVRNRGILRKPRSLWDATWRQIRRQPKPKEFDVRTEEDWQDWLKNDGEVAMFHKQPFKPESIKNVGPKLRENLQVDNYSTTELRDLLDYLRSTGKQVVVVIPPVPLDAWKDAGVDMNALRAGTRLITDTAGEYGFPTIDFTERGFKNGVFVDLLHANDLGSLQFSKALAAELDELRS